jgi:cell division protein FtsQ
MPALKSTRARKPAPKRPRRKGLPKSLRTALRWGLPAVLFATAAVGGTWIYTSGRVEASIAAARDGAIGLTARAGLRVQNVLVLGRNRADRDEVTRALGAVRGQPILAFDPHAAKTRLEKINWVRAAEVERRLPDTIYLRLVEREPLALWQHDGKLALIDREGVVITREHLGRFPGLPMIVGANAAEHAEKIIDILRARPAVAETVSAIVRVAGRRWDLRLKNDVTVQLPEDGAARAVARLAGLIARDGILTRDVIAIDMRLPDRLVVRTRHGSRPLSGADAGRNSKTRAAGGGARRPARDT